jgi:restriction endonuclease S subunit
MSAECVRVVSGKFYLLDSGFTFSIAEPFSGRATKEFVTRLLLNIQEEIYECGRGHAQKNIDIGAFKALEIPLPPLEVQKEIVTEIEGYQKVIDGARAVLDNYRPHIPIHPDWPKRNVGSLAENMDSRRVPITKGDRKEGPFPYYGASGIVDYVADFIFDEDILLISEDGANLLVRSTPIAFSVSGKCWVNNHAHVLTFQHSATQTFVEHYLNSISIEDSVTGAAQPKLTQEALNRIPIAIPDDVATQRAIVAEIEAEQSLVNANRELIARMEKKIQATLARVWGEDKGGTPK